MDLHKIYYDGDGNPRRVLQLVKQEPEWAANRLQEGERAIELPATVKNTDSTAMDLTVAAVVLSDEVQLYSPDELRYVDGKIEVPVGGWARRRLRELAVQKTGEA